MTSISEYCLYMRTRDLFIHHPNTPHWPSSPPQRGCSRRGYRDAEHPPASERSDIWHPPLPKQRVETSHEYKSVPLLPPSFATLISRIITQAIPYDVYVTSQRMITFSYCMQEYMEYYVGCHCHYNEDVTDGDFAR